MTGQVHYAGHELGVMAAGRGQKRGLIDAEGGDPGQPGRIGHQRPAMVTHRLHHRVPAHAVLDRHRRDVVAVLADPPARLRPGPFGQRRPRPDRLAGLGPGPLRTPPRRTATPASPRSASPAGPLPADPAPAPAAGHAVSPRRRSPGRTPPHHQQFRSPARTRRRPPRQPAEQGPTDPASPSPRYRHPAPGPPRPWPQPPRIVRPQASPQAQAEHRVVRRSPRFMTKSL